MTKEMGHSLAVICYGVAAALIGGWLYLFDDDAISQIGSGIAGVSGVAVIYGLVTLGRALGRLSRSAQ